MSRSDSAATTARSLRSERERAQRRRIVFWSAILLLFLLGLVFGKPSYHWLKARRANQLATEAEALVHDGKLNDAASKYRAALQLDPLGYRPLAGAARLATRGSRPEAIDLWQEVMRLPECTAADRQEYVGLLLQRGSVRTAEKILQELLRTSPDARTLNLATQFYSKDGDETKALEFARLAVTRAPNDDAPRFQLAELLAKSTEARQRDEAKSTLWSLADKPGRWQKSAIEALARAPELSPNEQKKVLATLEALPDRDVVTDLLGAELRLKLQPENAEQIYRDAIAKWSVGAVANVAELARWLNLHKQSARVLELVPEERAVASEPLLLSRLDALANLERWPEIDALLERPDLALDPAVVESFRARNAMGRASPFDADLHWDRAITLAGNDPFKLKFVASFAEQSHSGMAAAKAYDQLGRFPEYAAAAQRGKQRLLEENGDAGAARNVAERLSTLAPDDVNAQAQLIYLNLLLSVDLEGNLAKAKTLVAKYPTRLSFRVMAALGFLRAQDNAAALAQFKGPPIEWSRTPPIWRAVYAATLAANEQRDAAREIVEKIPLEKLNKEERELIPARQTTR